MINTDAAIAIFNNNVAGFDDIYIFAKSLFKHQNQQTVSK